MNFSTKFIQCNIKLVSEYFNLKLNNKLSGLEAEKQKLYEIELDKLIKKYKLQKFDYRYEKARQIKRIKAKKKIKAYNKFKIGKFPAMLEKKRSNKSLQFKYHGTYAKVLENENNSFEHKINIGYKIKDLAIKRWYFKSLIEVEFDEVINNIDSIKEVSNKIELVNAKIEKESHEDYLRSFVGMGLFTPGTIFIYKLENSNDEHLFIIGDSCDLYSIDYYNKIIVLAYCNIMNKLNLLK